MDFATIGGINNISVSEAIKNRNWNKATNEEYKSLIDMKTWSLVRKPKDVKPLTCRWVLCKKKNGQFKARIVIKRIKQRENMDFFEIFSPVARHMSIRLVLSIAASENMYIMTFDVKTSDLHGILRERI